MRSQTIDHQDENGDQQFSPEIGQFEGVQQAL
jgi:hypothetical protein